MNVRRIGPTPAIQAANWEVSHATPLPVTVGHTDAFGNTVTTKRSPRVQIDAIYGLRDVTDTEVFSATGGSAIVSDNLYTLSTGTSVGGYGLVRSQRTIANRAGEGIEILYTAAFDSDNAVALSAQRAGGVNVGDELSFGYNGENFGLLYRTGGKLEIRRLTIDSAASGSETATITLDGTAFTVDLTSGTVQHNAYEVAEDTFTGWIAHQVDDQVYFTAQSVGDKSGAYSFSSSTATGTFETLASGQAVTDEFVNQEDWSVDPMIDGTGPSGVTLVQSNLNIYRIFIGYLGAANLVYQVYDPEESYFHTVHVKEIANNQATVNLYQPSLKLGWFAASLGSTTDITLKGASGGGFVHGEVEPRRNPESYQATNTSVGTTFENVLSLRVRDSFQNVVNLNEVIIDFVNVAVDGTKNAEAIVVVNPEITGETNWQHINESASIMDYTTSDFTIVVGSGSQEVGALALSRVDSDKIDFSNIGLRILRNQIITVAVRATSGSTESTVSITWNED